MVTNTRATSGNNTGAAGETSSIVSCLVLTPVAFLANHVRIFLSLLSLHDVGGGGGGARFPSLQSLATRAGRNARLYPFLTLRHAKIVVRRHRDKSRELRDEAGVSLTSTLYDCTNPLTRARDGEWRKRRISQAWSFLSRFDVSSSSRSRAFLR